MKKIIAIFSIVIFVLINSCTNSQSSAVNLIPTDFQDKINSTENAIIIDVRTPEEYEVGYIKNAINIDWNNNNFTPNILKIDKSKPIFVYCLSGGRSGKAAVELRKEGFKEVYELNGGMMSWRNSKLPETTLAGSGKTNKEISLEEYNKLVNSDKLVLIDVYAEWCGPCKKMAPYLDEISQEMSDKVTIIRIDADKNSLISTELNIEALPTLILYKNNSIVWRNIGLQTKQEIIKQIQLN